MKTNKQQFILILILSLPILFLSACEGADLDLLEIAFEAWAEENNLYENGEYKPANMAKVAVDDLIGDITNSEENVQFDGIAVVRDIEKADELAEQAWKDKEKEKLVEAINTRPEDWRFREQMAAFSLSQDDIGQGVGVNESDSIIRKRVREGGDCVNLRTQQLEYRESLFEEHMSSDDQKQFEMQYIQSDAQEELQGIYATGNTPFCDQ
jgi:hypothetical protein